MARSSGFVRCGLCGLLALLLGFATSDVWAKPGVIGNVIDSPAQARPWQTDYGAALELARQQKTMVVVWFYGLHHSDENDKWELAVMRDAAIQGQLASFVTLKLPLTAKGGRDGENPSEISLLDHPAFAEMLHQPGLAMIDMSDEASPRFHHVVSVFPFVKRPISKGELAIMLALPPGSLTQRTLIWAVRTHHEQPHSAGSTLNSLLEGEAEKHSLHQASINLQGHHNWDQRFQNINSHLGAGMLSREVCAESWPGQRLVEAAEECVHSWRQSSGHWDAVSGKHDCFGYDMKLGTSGIWYATGIFGDRR